MPEVIELLKDRSVNPVAFEAPRKMKAMRQTKVAEVMISAGNFTAAYAKALLAATRQLDLPSSSGLAVDNASGPDWSAAVALTKSWVRV